MKKQTLKDFEIIIVSGPGAPGSSHARNLGIRFSKAKFIAFLDDDAYPNPDWLEQFLCAYEKKHGIIESYVDHPTSKWVKCDIQRHMSDLQETSLANFALYPREVFDKTGLYDTRFRKTGFNEMDFSIRARKKGFKIIKCINAKVFHKMGKRRFRKTILSSPNFFLFLLKHPLYFFIYICLFSLPILNKFVKYYELQGLFRRI